MSNIRVRELRGVRAVTTTPSEEELAIIAGEMFAGRQVSADEIRVRTMRLAHNQYDTTCERFPKAYLDRFSETLPGKGVLCGHDYGSLPVGRMFAARTVGRQETEFPMLVRDAAGRVPAVQWEPQDLRVLWTEPRFYTRAGTELDQDMDLGIVRDVSIGFRYDDLECDICKASYWRSNCPHVMGYDWNTEPGQIATGTYSGDPKRAEALEGSLVWLGAQQRARLTKAIREGNIDPKALASTPFGEDLVALKEAEAYARRLGHQVKSWAFPDLKFAPSPVGEEGAPPVGGEETPASVGANDQGEETPVTDEEKRALEQRATDAEAALAEAQEALKAAEEGKKATEDALAAREALAKVGEKALAEKAQAILDDVLRLEGKDDPLMAETVKRLQSDGNFEMLAQIAEQKRAAVFEKFPTSTSADPSVTGNEAPAPNGRPQEYHVL